MILAYHSIFGMYGFWLPNDPRGSGSDYIASWELFRYGPATKTDSRRSVAHRPLPPHWQREAQTALSYPPVSVTGGQALAIGAGFATAAGEGPYRIYACDPSRARAPRDRRQRCRIRPAVGHIRSRATHTLRERQLWDADRPLWGAHGWNVYLESVAAVEPPSDTSPRIRSKRGKNGNTGPSSSPLWRVTRYKSRSARRPSACATAAAHRRRGAEESPGCASQATRRTVNIAGPLLGTQHRLPRRLGRVACDAFCAPPLTLTCPAGPWR